MSSSLSMDLSGQTGSSYHHQDYVDIKKVIPIGKTHLK